MKLLITGATGRVGSRLVPRLAVAGFEVRTLVRNANTTRPGVSQPSEFGMRTSVRDANAAPSDIETVIGDLRDPDALKRAVAGVDAVVHVAATLRDGADEATTVAINTDATIELARAALAAGSTRFVFTSTNLVYGGGHHRPQRESDEPRPSNWPSAYPPSKLAAERALAPLGLDLRVLRLAYVYGDGDPHLSEGLERWAGSWHPAKRMQTVHHADVAQAFVRALRVDGIAGRTYNVADDMGVSGAQMHALFDLELPTGAIDRALADPFEGIVDTTLIRADLGFRPIYPTVLSAYDAGAA